MTVSKGNLGVVKWSEIDQMKFFSYGTIMYSFMTFGLHPISVLKTRQQVLSDNAMKKSMPKGGDRLLHQPTLKATFRDIYKSPFGIRGFFRGAGVVVSLAIPARVLYIGILENCRHDVGDAMMKHAVILYQSYSYDNADEANAHELLVPIVAALAGGVAGGLSSMLSQVLVVPMDVISQRQMVMSNSRYAREGSAYSIIQSILRTDGPTGLYRGFGVSIMNSLPGGSIWWATYSGAQVWVHPKLKIMFGDNDQISFNEFYKKFTTQVFASFSAAVATAVVTQPLDVIKTRMQVGNQSYYSIITELMRSSGMRGFYRGLGPRIGYITIWGTCLSSGYEMLRYYSRKQKPT